ncbi:hypothetical protein DNX69_20390 [Rhodopseudomonas palustris]|uniref:Methyltransferase type 11 domain-containing protein n=1 Tax=Rhodopseudomonas palustris TaxID=1076 RepID=A0A323UBT8_RHOPL|nr:hypothetical protein DNX69_20390 [Rhodopseudomonas palustris]
MLQSDDLPIKKIIERLYGDGQAIWDAHDRWNRYKRAGIDGFAKEFVSPLLARSKSVLDAGCGCQPYSWTPPLSIGFDIFEKQLAARQLGVVGDVSRLPFRDGSFEFIICVASVMNYVPALETISEFSRTLRQGGHLLLHYETSTSFEHFLTRRWGAPVTRINTLNNGREDAVWVYSSEYIDSVLTLNGFRVLKQRFFHIASALLLRVGFSQQRAAGLAALDCALKPFDRLGDDRIILAEKL